MQSHLVVISNMANSWQCVLALVVVVLCYSLPFCEAAKDGGEPCSEEEAVRLDAVMANTSCGYVEGRVQVCENGVWKNLCDSSWTEKDAQVACKSNYTALGAQNRTTDQTVGIATTYGVDCTGEEKNISKCDRTTENEDGVCQKVVFALCFTDESRVGMECMESGTNTSMNPPMPPTTPSPAGDTTAPPTPPLDSTPQATTGSGTATDPFSMTDSRGFFAPPTLYYFVGGLSAIILAAVLLILVTVICCCGCLRHKVSPADSEQQEKSKMQAPYGEESQKSKDHMTTHHQIQQSSAQPIYEAISNENSSTHSQGSPSSKPLMPPTTGELYASLDNTNTYAQIQPHIPVRGTTSTPSTPATPDPNANYQVLQHRAFSLRRELPGRPQAVNRTALALAHGEVEERDLSGQNKANGVMAGSSRSLPRNTGYSSTSLPLPPEPVHLVPQPPRQEQVQLQNLATEAESSEQANIYHILEPPPQYGNLEQIDEYSQVSNTAVCNNNNRQSPPFSPKYSQHGHIPPHPRSATLPSMHSSPRTSRTNSQSSNSPQTQRQSKSPQISRVGVQKANRPSDSPGSTRGASSSPNVNYSAISNRLSGQSGHSDSNDIQSNFSERSVIDTLV